MTNPNRRPMRARWLSIAALALAAALALSSCTANKEAKPFPSDTIEVIVPFTAGGPTDTVARILGEPMGKILGQQMIVDNVGGAGGTLGAGEVAKADPDGYTTLVHHIGMSTAPSLYKNLAYDPVKDFKPVGLITEVPMTILTRKGLGPKNLTELVEYLKQNSSKVTLANAGVGSASNLCGLLIEKAVGVDLREVPYEGAAPAIKDLVGGEVDVLCDQTTNTTSQIKAGQVEVYAITTPERVKSLPDVPTTKEAGLPELELGVWHGMYVPAETPDEVVTKLSEAMQKALADPTVAEKFGELGTTPSPAEDATPKALAARLDEQLVLWGDLLKDQKP